MLERVRSAQPTGEGTAKIFDCLAQMANLVGDSALMSLNLDYQYESDVIQEGDLVPVISFSLRPATYVQPDLDVPSGPTTD